MNRNEGVANVTEIRNALKELVVKFGMRGMQPIELFIAMSISWENMKSAMAMTYGDEVIAKIINDISIWGDECAFKLNHTSKDEIRRTGSELLSNLLRKMRDEGKL